MSLADDLRNEARCVHPAAADAMRFAADELDRLIAGRSVTDEQQAQQALAALTAFYREPVRRVSDYCAVFDQWAELIAASSRIDLDEAAVFAVRLAVRKSSYLARRLYDGEAHRTEPCPVHKGEWSGLPILDEPPCGCHLTGWLPAPKASS